MRRLDAASLGRAHTRTRGRVRDLERRFHEEPAARDWASPAQSASILNRTYASGLWSQGIPVAPTADAGCFMGGRLVSSGAQNDFVAYRFGFSPRYSIWLGNLLYTQGPNNADIAVYMARVPDDDPFNFPSNPVNALSEIDAASGDFAYVFCARISGYAATLTRNKQASFGIVSGGGNPFTTTAFRVTGEPGANFTTAGLDPDVPLGTTGDGGPGVYAVKLVAETQDVSSGGYTMMLQDLSFTRTDGIWP